jgi:C-terminal associated domain of TOPRIM
MLSAGILVQIKYYKGLGTSNTDEAREYFSRIDKHRKEFEWQGDCRHARTQTHCTGSPRCMSRAICPETQAWSASDPHSHGSNSLDPDRS